ncbi:MAG: hypothetical protein ACM3PP_06405, partial [Candidatus Saccharibacteria bacterium]
GDLKRAIINYYHVNTPYDLVGVLKETGAPSIVVADQTSTEYANIWPTAYRQHGYTVTDYIQWVRSHRPRYDAKYLNSAYFIKSEVGSTYNSLLMNGYTTYEIALGVKNSYNMDQTTLLGIFMGCEYKKYGLSNQDVIAGVDKAFGVNSVMDIVKSMLKAGSSLEQVVNALDRDYSIKEPNQVASYLVEAGCGERDVLWAIGRVIYHGDTTRDTIDKLCALQQEVFKHTDKGQVFRIVMQFVNGDEPEGAVSVMSQRGYTLQEMVQVLKDYYSQNVSQTISVLRSRFGLSKEKEIVATAMAVYGLDPVGYIQFVKQSGYSVTLSIDTLGRQFGINDPEKIAAVLAQAGYSQNEVLQGLMDAFYGGHPTAEAMKTLGGILQKVFNQTNGAVAAILKAAGVTDPSIAITVLHNAGYSLDVIVRALKDIYNAGSGQAINLLTRSGYFQSSEISSQVQSVYGGDYVLLYIQYWQAQGYSAGSCYSAMADRLNITDPAKRFTYLRSAGYSEDDAWTAVKNNTHAWHDDWFTILKNAYGCSDPIALAKQFSQIPAFNDYRSTQAFSDCLKRAFPGISIYTAAKALQALGIPGDSKTAECIWIWLRGNVKNQRDDQLAGILGSAHPDDLGLNPRTAAEIIKGMGYNLQEAAKIMLDNKYRWEDGMFESLVIYYAPKNYQQSYFDNNNSSKFIIMDLKNSYDIVDLAKGDVAYYDGDHGYVYYDLISAGYSVEDATIIIIKTGEGAVADLVPTMVDCSIARANLTGNHSLRLNAVQVADILYNIGVKTPGVSFSLKDIAKGLVDHGPNAGAYAAFTHSDVYDAMKLITGKYLQSIGASAPADVTALYIMREVGLSSDDAATMLAEDRVGLSTGSIVKSIFGIGNDWFNAVGMLAGAGYSYSDSIRAIYSNKDYHLIIGISVLSAITTKALTWLDESGNVANIIKAVKQVGNYGFKIGAKI